MAGSWVDVLRPGGVLRRDWVPSEQPPSPDGTPGTWHVVNDHRGGESRWEWHPKPAPLSATGVTALSATGVTAAPPIEHRPAGRISRPAAAVGRVPQNLTSNVRRGSAAAVFIGGLMPWATIGPFAITGSTVGGGKVLMAVALAALALSLAPRRLPVRFLDAALAAFALLASIANLGNTSTLASKIGPVLHVKVGSGLIVCACASGLWLVSLVWEQGTLIRERRRRRTRYAVPAWLQPAT